MQRVENAKDDKSDTMWHVSRLGMKALLFSWRMRQQTHQVPRTTSTEFLSVHRSSSITRPWSDAKCRRFARNNAVSFQNDQFDNSRFQDVKGVQLPVQTQCHAPTRPLWPTGHALVRLAMGLATDGDLRLEVKESTGIWGSNLHKFTKYTQAANRYSLWWWLLDQKGQRYQRSHPLKDLNMFGGRYK